MNKKNKFKWENINANEKSDFELVYKNTIKLLAHLNNTIQQLAAAYKNKENNN